METTVKRKRRLTREETIDNYHMTLKSLKRVTESKSDITTSEFHEKHGVSNSLIPNMIGIGLLSKPEGRSKLSTYTWKSEDPSIDMANELRSVCNDKIHNLKILKSLQLKVLKSTKEPVKAPLPMPERIPEKAITRIPNKVKETTLPKLEDLGRLKAIKEKEAPAQTTSFSFLWGMIKFNKTK